MTEMLLRLKILTKRSVRIIGITENNGEILRGGRGSV